MGSTLTGPFFKNEKTFLYFNGDRCGGMGGYNSQLFKSSAGGTAELWKSLRKGYEGGRRVKE